MEGLWRQSLDEYVSYDINWGKLFLGKEQSSCTLWIKAKNKEGFSRITVCITASLETLRYQSVVTIFDVNDVPCVAAIPSIPLREVEVRGNVVYQPYSEISIELIEAFDTNNMPVNLRYKIKETMHPIDNLEAAMGLRKSNVYRWGKWWNLDFLEMEKNELAVILHGISFHSKFYRSRMRYFWTTVAWIGKKKWALELCFWMRNLITARQLKKALNEYLKDHNEIKRIKKSEPSQVS